MCVHKIEQYVAWLLASLVAASAFAGTWPSLWNSMMLASVAYVLALMLAAQLTHFTGTCLGLNILPALGVAYGGVLVLTQWLFLDGSQGFVCLHALVVALVYGISLLYKHKKDNGAYLLLGTANLEQIQCLMPQKRWLVCSADAQQHANLEATQIRAVVVDTHQAHALEHAVAPEMVNALGLTGATVSCAQLVVACRRLGVPVMDWRAVLEQQTGRARLEGVTDADLVRWVPNDVYVGCKRIIDTLMVVLSLPLVLPIMGITALAIRFESTGAVLFKQTRVGMGGKTFKIYKFRSMYSDSEKDGAQLAQVGDTRITRVGHFIRKTRLDELPQLLNVLKGDMSLIGPRPEQEVFVKEFEDNIAFYQYRHVVKPGLSGWAQVMQGYAGNADETQLKLEYDFYYIKHFSFALDVLIFLKTLRTIITGFGAR